jgi:hypothetical protein
MVGIGVGAGAGGGTGVAVGNTSCGTTGRKVAAA